MKFSSSTVLSTTWLAALAALAVAVPIPAQDTRGLVQGMIVSPTGASVPGANVTLQNDATGISASRQSMESGRFLFDQVDPGQSTVTAKHQGFSTVIHKNVRVQQRGDVTVDIALKLTDVVESGSASWSTNGSPPSSVWNPTTP